jgi:hypothetical protein
MELWIFEMKTILSGTIRDLRNKECSEANGGILVYMIHANMLLLKYILYHDYNNILLLTKRPLGWSYKMNSK